MNPQRTRTFLHLLTLFALVLATVAGVMVPAAAAAQTPTCVTSRISVSADDAEQRTDTNAMDLDGDTETKSLQMYRAYSGSSTSTLNWWGMRFLSVAVPQGATITSAAITFRANANSSGSTAASMTLWGQLAANPGTFTTTASNITSRTRTTASATWSVPVWTSGTNYDSASLSTIVQEIVNQSGWASNNAMVIIGQATGDQNRSAISRDSTNGSTLAPQLSVCYTPAPVVPTITTTGSLSNFRTVPGMPSVAQSYTVAGSNLTANITITPPAGFELSTNGTTYASSLSLTQTSGSVAATTIYVRLTGATLGDYSGNLAHTSTGATTVNVAVSGRVADEVCETMTLTTVDDTYLSSANTGYNYGAQTYLRSTLYTTNPRGTLLRWDTSGIPTTASVSAASMTVNVSTAATASFNLYNMRRAWVEGTGAGADTDDGASWQTYDGSNSWGTVGAANTTSDRYDTNLWGATSSTFSSAGSKTIDLNSAGVAAVQGWVTTPATNYGVTIQNYGSSASELDMQISSNNHATAANHPKLNITYCAGPARTLTVTSGGNGSVTLNPPGGAYMNGRTVTLTPVANAGYVFDSWTGANAGEIVETSGVYTIVMNGNKAVTANFIVSQCTDIAVDVAEDTHMRSGTSRAAYNYGGSTLLRVNPFYEQGSTDGQLTGALLKWNLSGVTIPAGATVSGASITFNVSTGSNYAYSLYNMRRSWTEGTANGASGTGASWTYYGAGTGAWGTEGAANTSSDRYDTNLWNATAAQFNTTGSVTFALNASGVDVVRGWLAGTVTNNGLTIQNYAGTTTDVWEAASSEATTAANRPKMTITYCLPPTGPTITTSGTLQAFAAVIGSPSAEQSYTVSAVNLTEALAISAPADFQISTTSGSGFGSTLSLTPSSGSVSATIYVRFQRATTGSSSGNIGHTSAGATARQVAVSGTATSAPPTIALSAPADNATNVALAPSLQATVSDPEGDPMTVSFYARVAGATGGDEFTFVAIPDTQNAAQSYPTTLNAQFDWIVAQAGPQDFAFVTNLGDIVNTASDTAQWANADTAYDKLDAGGVWYSVSPGNHDLGGLYNTYFGPSRFAGKSYYQGPMTAGANENNYSFFSAGGMDFIVINLTYNPGSTVLNWADALLKANTGRRGIVVQHDILNTDNSWNNQASYTALKDNPNLFLMLCGHMHTSSDGTGYRGELGDDGHTIHIVLTDFQDFANGGSSYLRLLRFVPAEDEIRATTYSPTLGTSLTSAANYEQFDMVYDMPSAAPFELIGTLTNVSNGTASLSWPGRAASTEYEWYATVSDGGSPVSSAEWSFTTGTGTPVTYQLAVTKSGSGSVSSSPAGIDCGATCSASFSANAVVQLTAAPATGYSFTSWSGDCTGTATTCSVTMSAAKNVVATFTINSYNLTVTANPTAGGTTSPTGVTSRTHGEIVNVTATANAGYTFSGWGGACTGTGTCSVTMDAAKSVVANFTLNNYALTVTNAGGGTVTSVPAGISCGSDCTESYAHGTAVVLTAAPATGYSFTGWSGGVCSGSATTCSVTMDAAKSVVATFTINSYNLTIGVSPTGGGTTTPAAGSYSHNHGAIVSIAATPATGYNFTGWSGACTGTTSPCSVTMDAAKTVTANFALKTYVLTVTKSGTGSGSVSSSPAGITCGADCSETLQHGTVVVLTATPDASSTFGGWSGAGCTGTGTCSLTMDDVKNVNATFTLKSYDLTVTANPAAGGTTSPSGTSSRTHGEIVNVTATANAGYTFTGWGGACTGTGACNVTMDAAKSVTANFTLNNYALSVTKSGQGTVTSTPAGIDCGATCAASFAYNTQVTLNAVAASGFTFGGWSGAGCSGTGACNVTMDAAKNVTANFTLNNYALSVTKSGTGSGSVSSNPAGISCGSDCGETLSHGTVVVLTAAPSAGSTFGGWSGAGCTGTGDCTVTMDAAKSVDANFTLNGYALTVDVNPAGAGATNPSGVTSHGYGANVTVTATANPGYTFSSWSGACSGSGACSVTMTEARSVTANFTLNSYNLTIGVSPTGGGTTTPAAGSSTHSHGAVIALSATPSIGYSFVNWTGADAACSANPICQVTMDGPKSVTANFAQNSYTLSVTKSGEGTVTSAPAGISCGADCSEAYLHGTQVTLTAAPSAGHTFSGWSGGVCSGSAATCVVSMTSARAVTATFVPISLAPSVTSVAPAVGPATGGTAVTVGGANFVSGATVSFGGAACTSVVVASATQINCNTAAHGVGVVDVTVTNPDAKSGTLTGGFTYEPTTATLTLGSVTGMSNSEVTVLLSAAALQGLYAGDLDVRFDPAVVQVLDVRKGALIAANEWSINANVPTAGRLLISFAGSLPVSGSGPLVEIDLKLIGAHGATTALDLYSALLNGGAITATLVDGSATVESLYDISGAVRYWDQAVAVPGVLLTLDGASDFTASSSATGDYQINDTPAGNYVLTPSYSGDVREITAYDAALVLQHAVVRSLLAGHAFTAGDVDASGAVNSMDASYILRKAAGLIDVPFPGAGRIWAFAPASYPYTGLNANKTAQDFVAILIGDPSGSWADDDTLVADDAAANLPSVKLTAGTPEAGGVRTVEVRLVPAPGQSAWSLELNLNFDGAAYTALDPAVVGSWMMASNPSPSGTLRVAMAGSVSVNAPTQVLTLRFQPTVGQIDPAIAIKSVLIDEIVGLGLYEQHVMLLPLIKAQ